MKKFGLFIGAVLLAASACGFMLFSSQKENVEEVKAEYGHYEYETYSGLYERIEDPSLVAPGTKVVLATLGGYVFEGIGGNPGYAHSSPSNAMMFEDYAHPDDDTKFLYIKNKVVAVLNVEEGYQAGTVSFTSDFIVDSSYKYKHQYLAANSENYYDGGLEEYDSIAWFLDSFGMSSKHNAKSSWTLQYDSDANKMLIRNCSSNDATTYIRYDYNGARHHFKFDTAYNSNVNLYRLVDTAKLDRADPFSPAPTHTPTKTTYHKGDVVSFDGLIVSFGITRGDNSVDTYQLEYNYRTASLFSSPATLYDYNITYAEVRIFEGFRSILYTFQITVENSASFNVFNKITSIPSDLRGTYLLTDNRPRIYNLSVIEGSTMNYYSVTSDQGATDFANGVINANDVDIDQCAVQIVRTQIGDSYYYHALDNSGRYLCMGSQVGSYDEYYVSQTTTASVSNAITFVSSGNCIYLKMGNYYLEESFNYDKLVSFNNSIGYDSFLFKLSE